jgi:hypothetical protein
MPLREQLFFCSCFFVFCFFLKNVNEYEVHLLGPRRCCANSEIVAQETKKKNKTCWGPGGAARAIDVCV